MKTSKIVIACFASLLLISLTISHETLAGCVDLCSQQQDNTWAVCLSSKECVDRIYINETCCTAGDFKMYCEEDDQTVNAYRYDNGQCVPWCCDLDGVCGNPSGSSTFYGQATGLNDALSAIACPKS